MLVCEQYHLIRVLLFHFDLDPMVTMLLHFRYFLPVCYFYFSQRLLWAKQFLDENPFPLLLMHNHKLTANLVLIFWFSSRCPNSAAVVPEKVSIWLKLAFGAMRVVTSVSLHLELISVLLVVISENLVHVVFK